MLLLEANQLVKHWGDRLVFKQEEPLLLYKKMRVGIIGANGAGKTTLLTILAGENEPDEGIVKRHGAYAMLAAFEEWEQEAALSGGEKTRRKLETALQLRAPILFADEPTSHMDLDGILRVEQELARYDGLVVLVSHDRELLDAVCTHVLELDQGRMTLYTGGYTDYKRQKKLEDEEEHFEYEQYAREKKRLEAAIRDKSARAAGMRKPPKRMGVKEARLGSEKGRQKQEKVHGAVSSLKTRLEMLKPVDKPKELPAVRFDINGFVPVRGKTALRLEQVSREMKGQTLFAGVTAFIRPGVKLALLGPNGSGKTTLLEMIRSGAPGIFTAESGRVGYFQQNLAALQPERSVLDNVRAGSPYPEAFIRNVLARLLFRGEDVFKPVSVLSGGERVRAALAKVFVSGCNIMLLDEPSNYLDIEAREELEQVLEEYPGTVLLASHDRRLISRVADQLLLFESGNVRLFDGTYESFRQSAAEENQPEKKKLPIRSADNAGEERLQLEFEIAEVLGKLSVLPKGKETEGLEARFSQLLERRKELERA